MGETIYCPRCGAENSPFALFMTLARCRQCGYDLEMVMVREALRRGESLRGQSDLYTYEVTLEGARFSPRGVLTASPLEIDVPARLVRITGEPGTAPGVSVLWKRLTGEHREIPFEQVARIEVVYHTEKLSREDHPYLHHWDVALVLKDGERVPLGRISAERQFPGPVLSHHHALRLAHALHVATGWPVEQRTQEAPS
ncbi:MAG: hypothetical protein ACP5SI_06590 [Chloroflexia bacterium]